jgi:hypothetical protein
VQLGEADTGADGCNAARAQAPAPKRPAAPLGTGRGGPTSLHSHQPACKAPPTPSHPPPPAHQSTRPSPSSSDARRAASAAATDGLTLNPGGGVQIAAPTRCSVASGRPVGSWPAYDRSRAALAIDWGCG